MDLDVELNQGAERAQREPEWWGRLTLVIAAAAAVLYAWNLPDAGFAPYYSAAVRSQSLSWRAMFFDAFDPGSAITIDKLGGAFLPQAITARIFGFHAWALALPQVVYGVVATLVLYRAVRRWVGPAAGVAAAAVFTFTPVLTSMFGHAMEDGLLTVCLVLAADRFQYALVSGRTRPLLIAGLWIGLGFQAKMIVAWTIVPALAIAYFAGTQGSRARRLARLTAFGAVTLISSLLYMVVFTLVPAGSRPFVDGSTDNGIFASVFGYNALARFGIHLPGALPAPGGLTHVQITVLSKLFGTGNLGALEAISGENGISGWGKLFGEQVAPQIGWLYPLAAAGLLLGLRLTWRDTTRRVERAGYLMWGIWLLTAGLELSASTLPHLAYTALLGPPLAALSASGLVTMTRAYRTGSRLRHALPVTLVAEAVWTTRLWWPHRDFLGALLFIALATAVLALLLMLLRRPGLAAPVAIAAMLLAPTVWAGSVLDAAYAGSAYEASAGPPGVILPPQIAAYEQRVLHPADRLDPTDQRIYDYANAHRGTARYVFATDLWLTAETFINTAGAAVLPMGGYSGDAPSPTPTQVTELVSSGRLRFFLLTPSPAADETVSTTLVEIEAWVRATCHPLGASLPGLYDCTRAGHAA